MAEWRSPYHAAMHLVSVDGIAARVDDRTLFASVSFGLRMGDRVGVVGPNGVGKSTLLAILAGEREPDGGSVVFRRNVRVAFLPQEPTWPDAAAHTIVRSAGPAVTPYEADALLDRVGIDPTRNTSNMSQGQRRRVALARTLVSDSDLLILDEPTNHLDIDTVDWLEQELRRRQTAIVMVTHDRYVLERVANKMLDIDPQAGPSAFWHNGSYSTLLGARANRLEAQQALQARARNLLRKELAWLQRQPKARTSKPKFRQQQVEQIRQEASSDPDATALDLGTGRRRLGNDVVELRDVTVTRGTTRVLNGIDLTIGPGDRIAVVGPNGAGKTTLLEVITGRRTPDVGQVRTGTTVQIGMYEQQALVAATEESVIDSLLAIAAHIPLTSGETLPAGRLAERFGLTAAVQRAPIGRLSGGERRRLALLHLLLDAPNVIVLDEPTNDLDLDTLAVLEDYLDGFAGTLIVASHDRYVLDRLTDRTLLVEDGALIEFADLDAYRSRTTSHGLAPTPQAGVPEAATDNRTRQVQRKRLRSLEQRVSELERARVKLHTSMAAAAHDPDQLVELQQQLHAVDADLADAEHAWFETAEAVEREVS